MIASDFFEGPVASFILHKNLEGLKESLRSRHFNPHQEGYGYLSMSLVELAVATKWHDGLQILSTRWSDEVTGALEFAAYEGDTLSLELLLNDFDGGVSWWSVCKILLSSEYVSDFLRHWMWDQRRNLRHWYEPFRYYYIQTMDVLMVSRSEFSTRASHKMIEVGALSGLYFYIAASVINSITRKFMREELVERLDALFQIGFMGIDQPMMVDRIPWPENWLFKQCGTKGEVSYTRTPLHYVLENVPSYGHCRQKHATLCIWFLQKGASPVFCHSVPRSNLLLELARSFQYWVQTSSRSRYWEELVRYASGLCDAMERDDSICFCSPKGRLPLALPMLRHRHSGSVLCMGHTQYHTFHWVQLCRLDSEDANFCVEESVRLELFHRLGLRHTCCPEIRYSPEQLEDTMSTEEKGEIRKEDEEAAGQLELLMEAYRGSLHGWLQVSSAVAFKSHHRCSNTSCKGYYHRKSLSLTPGLGLLATHWRHWWDKVSQILVRDWGDHGDDSSSDSGNESANDSRNDSSSGSGDDLPCTVSQDEKQVLTLKQHGYEGMEFMEVIRQHFATELGYYQEIMATGASSSAEQATPKPRKAFIPKEQPEILDGLMEYLCRGHERNWV